MTMTTYAYGRIKVLAENLERANVAPETRERIMEGGEDIAKAAHPAKKARWMSAAMLKMDALLDEPLRRDIREGCACCLGGKRLQLSKQIAKAGGTLDERIAAANATPFVFGHSVKREDGNVVVAFSPDGQPSYRCVCLPHADGAVSPTYCMCCGGHIKHHLQIALGRKVECRVRHTALTSAGTRPCVFEYTLLDDGG